MRKNYDSSSLLFFMNRPYFIFVGGINSSGKTSILKYISRGKIAYVSGSSYLMKWLGIKKGDYKKLQSLPDKNAKSELGKMVRYLTKEKTFHKNKKIVCIDAHYMNIRDGRTQAWVGKWLSCVDGLILIKSSPASILKRIEKDEKRMGRERNLFKPGSTWEEKIEQLRSFIEKNNLFFEKLTVLHSKPYKIIVNNKRGYFDAARTLKSFIDEQVSCQKKSRQSK